MENSKTFDESFAPEENMAAYRSRIDPTTLSREEFLIVDETIRAFNAAHAIVQQDVAPLWKAANRSLVASSLVGAGMYQTAKKFVTGKPNVPVVVAGLSWILAYRVTNFFYRREVMDNLINGDTKLSQSLRTALQQGAAQSPPALVQARPSLRRISQAQINLDEPREFPEGGEPNKPNVTPADARPRVSLLGGVTRPTDENGQRTFVTWDDIRARQKGGSSEEFQEK